MDVASVVEVPPSACTQAALLAAAAVLLWLGAAVARVANSLIKYSQLRLPSPPEPNAILGHALPLMSFKQPFVLDEWATQCGPIFKVRALFDHYVLLTDPEAIARVNR